MHYLAREHWSPRYDSTFFTIQITGAEKLTRPPSIPQGMSGKANHPAFYFQVEVFSEQKKHVCLRRYSHFKWLHEVLHTSPPSEAQHEDEPLRLPPGSCPWQVQDEEFITTRLDALRDYLRDVLSRPGYARHPAVRTFLELASFEQQSTMAPAVDSC
jgi:hypothetical protein